VHTDKNTPVQISEVWLHMYIFDWDFSFVSGYKKNPRVTHFKDQCSFVNSPKDVNTVLDLFTFLMDLLRFTKNNKPLVDFAEEVFPNYKETVKIIADDSNACDGHLPKFLQEQAIAPKIWEYGIEEVMNCSYIKPYIRFLQRGEEKASPKVKKGLAKNQIGSAKTQKGSAKTQKGSAKTQKGSAKNQKGSAKNQKGSAKNQKGSAKKTKPVK
jgi:hypothetical protein